MNDSLIYMILAIELAIFIVIVLIVIATIIGDHISYKKAMRHIREFRIDDIGKSK